MIRTTLLATCLVAVTTPALARNAADFWCGQGPSRIHLMLWIAKVRIPDRDANGKLIRGPEGYLDWHYEGKTYVQYGVINDRLLASNPHEPRKWLTIVPNRSVHSSNDYATAFRSRKCTEMTEKDLAEHNTGNWGPADDLRYPLAKLRPGEREYIKPPSDAPTAVTECGPFAWQPICPASPASVWDIDEWRYVPRTEPYEFFASDLLDVPFPRPRPPSAATTAGTNP
jgi:hypothetical protein